MPFRSYNHHPLLTVVLLREIFIKKHPISERLYLMAHHAFTLEKHHQMHCISELSSHVIIPV